MRALPILMVAPNGAYKTKADHRNLPITIDEIVETATTCVDAGADGLHLHIRDDNGAHSLDVGRYRELLSALAPLENRAYIQVTSEAAGKYHADEQIKMIDALEPRAVSVALREILASKDPQSARKFYARLAERDTEIQHILYSADDLAMFLALEAQGMFVDLPRRWLFVLGRYTANQESNPQALDPFLALIPNDDIVTDWAVCAFERNETDALLYARAKGGKMRVGFENSLLNADGSQAENNAERVREIKDRLNAM